MTIGKAEMDALKKQYDLIKGGTVGKGQRMYDRYVQGEKRRVNFLENWSDVANIFLPRKNDIYSPNIDGEKKNLDIYDANPIKYVRKLVNNLLILMINPSQSWFGFETGDKELDGNREVRDYMKLASDVIRRELFISNFYLNAAEFLTDKVVFGTGVQLFEGQTDRKKKNLFWFSAIPCHKTILVSNDRGDAVTIYSKMRYTATQLVLKYGMDILMHQENEFLRTAFLKFDQTLYDIIFGVEHKNDIFHRTKNSKHEFVGMHTLCNNKFVLKEEGFFENPYQVSRWTKLSDEEYGRGPGMDALPDAMTLNTMKQIDLQASQIAMAPPIQGIENSIIGDANLYPWGITFRRPGSDPLAPIFPNVRLDISDAKIKDLRQDIREHFFYDQMNLIEKDRMTSTEVVQRKDEDLREVASVMIRMDREWLRPTIERAFGLCVRNGKIPPPPTILQKKELTLKYTSPIAKALETEGADNITRALQVSAPVIQSDPTVMDNVDGDKVLRRNFVRFDVEPEFLRKEADVKKIRQSRAEANAELQETQVQNTDADTIQKLRS